MGANVGQGQTPLASSMPGKRSTVVRPGRLKLKSAPKPSLLENHPKVKHLTRMNRTLKELADLDAWIRYYIGLAVVMWSALHGHIDNWYDVTLAGTVFVVLFGRFIVARHMLRRSA